MPKKIQEIKTEKNKPAKSFRAGAVHASVFMNVAEKDGKKINIPSVSFQNRYRDEKGEWQTTNKLNVNDIPKAVLVLNEAYKYLTLKQHQDDFFV